MRCSERCILRNYTPKIRMNMVSYEANRITIAKRCADAFCRGLTIIVRVVRKVGFKLSGDVIKALLL